MARRLERLLQLDALLRQPQRQTAQTLADALEVSERTVRSDIEFLRDRYGAPITYSKALGHFYTDLDWRLPSIPLTKGELFALTIGARMLESYAGSAYVTDLHSAIAQLAKRLPEQAWVDLQQVADEQIVFRAGRKSIWTRRCGTSLRRPVRRLRRCGCVTTQQGAILYLSGCWTPTYCTFTGAPIPM